jgi:hypothetical protein
VSVCDRQEPHAKHTCGRTKRRATLSFRSEGELRIPHGLRRSAPTIKISPFWRQTRSLCVASWIRVPSQGFVPDVLRVDYHGKVEPSFSTKSSPACLRLLGLIDRIVPAKVYLQYVRAWSRTPHPPPVRHATRAMACHWPP